MSARSEDHAALGRAIKAIRGEKKLTQKQVSEASGLRDTYISDIERGIRNPTWSAINQMADALGVQPSEIAKRSEGEKKS
jgi:transcriptional regulator with XRE-family HTH domain